MGRSFQIPVLLGAIQNAKEKGTSLHLMGLVSDGGVHSHQDHLYALLTLAKQNGIGDRTYIHCFMDGRDVPPDSGKCFIGQLEDKIKEIGAGQIATVMGRYYAMDRDNRWDRVKKAYNAMALGEGDTAPDAQTAMQRSYDNKVMDEFVIPCVIRAGRQAGRENRAGRFYHLLQLPSGPCAGNHACISSSRILRGLSAKTDILTYITYP